MVQAGCELFDPRCFAVRAYAAKKEDRSSAGVGEEEIAIRRGPDEAQHGERAAAGGHDLLVISPLHRGRVAVGMKCNFETRRHDRP